MNEIKEDKDIWKAKIDIAINTFLSIQEDIHNSKEIITAKITKIECKLLELNKSLMNANGLCDDNGSLFSPYKNTAEQQKKVKIENEISSLKAELPKIKEELSQLIKKQERYNVIGECLNFLNDLFEKQEFDAINGSNNMEKNVNNIQSDDNDNSGVKLLETQEFERQRIARDLHDSTIQNLTNLMYKTELCLKLLDIDEIRVRLELATLINNIRAIINDMREIIFDLRPMTIQDLGLIPTIERFIKKYREQNKIQVVFNKQNEKKDILPVVNLTLYRIIQEACNNIVKHANATVCIINLSYEEKQIILTIEDNGIGIKEETEHNNDCNSGFGLSIMKERAILLSGSFNIESKADKGTKIVVTIPYREQKEE